MEMESLEIHSENGNGNGHPVETRVVDAGDDFQEDVGRLPALVESLLFAAAAPVLVGRLVEALAGPSRAEVLHVLDELARSYEREGRGLRLGYQLRTPAEHGPWVRRLLRERPPRLSRPMLETLAIVAYRQPCTRLDIEAVRGVDADAVLTTLLERRMVRITGRKETPGRPLLYTTTRDFLEVFGLPDLGALPPLRNLGEGADLLAAKDLTIDGEGVAVTLGSPIPPAPDEGE
jgi:segregation and condensation protein B